jgi:hypothetical protein
MATNNFQKPLMKLALDKILNDATNKGLTFISDRDARDPEDCIQVLTYGIQVLMLYLN